MIKHNWGKRKVLRHVNVNNDNFYYTQYFCRNCGAIGVKFEFGCVSKICADTKYCEEYILQQVLL
jgi:hypothetical protein